MGRELSFNLIKGRFTKIGTPLFVNFLWVFVGNIVYAGCQWGMLTALAKLGPPDIVGRFSLASAIASPVILFLNLQLRVVQSSDACNKFSFEDYLGVRLFTTTLAMFVIALLALSRNSVAQSEVIFVFGIA